VPNVSKSKIFLQENDNDIEKKLQNLNFNDFSSDKPSTPALAKLINYKKAAQLALIMLSEEGGANDIEMEIDSLCDGPWHPVTLKQIILN
jgi:hypothetical protein